MSRTLQDASSPPSQGVDGADHGRRAKLDRKANGVYYTPSRLAGLLAGWALARQPKRILEPSYGDGVFLREADAKLRESGVRNPSARLFGVEIDPQAPKRLRESGLKLREDHLHTADLLALSVEGLGGMFEAIIGNPPYIRHHLLDEDLARRGREGAKLLGVELNGRSDAWAYFCAHLVTFLSPGGRLALVLPGSVLQADYAKPLLRALAKEEGEVQLVRIGERLFAGVQERTVLLLIDRGRPTGGQVIHRGIANLKGLAPALKRELRRGSSAKIEDAEKTQSPRLPWRLKGKEAGVWEEVCASEGVALLGDLAMIRIGVVTGANAFFVRSEEEAGRLGKSVDAVSIVSRGAWVSAPRWSTAAQKRVAGKPSRLLLFPMNKKGLSKAAKEELRRAEEAGIDKRSHCAKRDPWYAITDAEIPDMFLPYMASQPPRLAINSARATCTNTIHRVWLNDDAAVGKEAIAAASWSTLYRLSAELVGRTYGGGVLKLEPSGAMALRMVVVGKRGLLGEIAKAHRANGVKAARTLADRRLLIEGLGMTKKEVDLLGITADRLSVQRRG